MLNPFGTLLTFSLIAPFFLRIVLGAIFIHFGYVHSKKTEKNSKILGVVEILGGVLLVIGLFTQIAAIVFGLLLAWELFKKIQTKAFLSDGINYYLVLFVIAISLIFTGAGFFAFDLPL